MKIAFIDSLSTCSCKIESDKGGRVSKFSPYLEKKRKKGGRNMRKRTKEGGITYICTHCATKLFTSENALGWEKYNTFRREKSPFFDNTMYSKCNKTQQSFPPLKLKGISSILWGYIRMWKLCNIYYMLHITPACNGGM